MGIIIKDILTLQDGLMGFEVKQKTVYVEGDRIAGIDEKPEGFEADREIDGKDRLLIPGLINCHTHAYMSLFRNCADDLAFTDWLFGNILPLEDKMEDEDAYWGAKLAMIEMIKSGTTCFTDMYIQTNQTTRVVKECGMRAVVSRGLTRDGEADEGGERRLKEALSEYEVWKDCDRIRFMLAPHAPYTCDAGYLRYVTDVAKKHGLGIHIHLAESKDEIANMKKAHNCTPIEYVQKAGIFEVPVLAAHCVNLTDSDMDILKAAGASVATNPVSNMKLGNGFADLVGMQEKGINICLGTDGAASNNSLNMFHEMNMAALIHKGNHQSAQCISAEDVLRFATLNGAKALGMADRIGKIEKGYKADLVILELNTPSFRPLNNLVGALAYSASGAEVDTVIVDGNILMDNRELTTIDEYEVYEEVERRSERLGIKKV